jgi:trigger factor
LQTSVERLEGNMIKLTVTVPAADVDREVEAAYKRLGAKLRIPGFRPGHAPRPVIDTHVGREAVLADAQEQLVSDSYGKAVSAEDLRTVGQPDVGELDLIEPGTDYTYTAEVMVRPELTLSSVEPVAVTVPPQHAEDREVDAQIEYTRERFATLEVVDRPVAANDFALISFVGTVDGEAYDGNTVDRYLYELGRGLMPTEFDDALVGAMPGDAVSASFEIPDTSSSEEFVGKQARFEIEVHEVKSKVLPELDDEFAANAGGFDTLEEYRADVREKLDAAKASAHARQVESAVLAALVERLEGEVPDEVIQSRGNSMTRDFFESLEQRQITLADYVEATGASPEQIQSDIAEQAGVRVREELALEALFRAKGLEITEEQLADAVLSIVGGDEAEAPRMRASLEQNGAMPIVREQLMHQMALEWLVDTAMVTEQAPTSDVPAAAPGKRAKKPAKSAKKAASSADAEATTDEPVEKE